MILLIPFGSRTSTSTATPGVEMTGLDVVTQALQEIGVLNATEAPSGEDADLGLAKCNRILDRWNVERKCAFAELLTPFTTTARLSPHTIGPTGTFVTVQRPMTIEGASYGPLNYPITTDRDAAWYASLSQPTLAGTPTDLYYAPTFPNGKLYLWPVPDAATTLTLLIRGLLASLTLQSSVSLPPGYRDALITTLAEELVAPMRVPIPPLLPGHAKDARATIFNANITVPRLTSDYPGSCRGGFNYKTGQ